MRNLEALIAELRQRDTDPAYASAPVLDAYARISLNPETGEMEKTDRQLSDILPNIAKRHARLGQVLRDDNMSAWRKGVRRPAWELLLSRLSDRTSKGVVCWHTDRLMRRSDDLATLINLAEGKGVVIGSCFGDKSLDSADDRFILRIEIAAAEKASDDTSRRQKRKKEDARRSGISNSGGHRPFGFPGKNATPETVAIEREAVAWAIDSHLLGKSLKAICREFHARGLTTTTGGQWVSANLRVMMCRARNAGLIEHEGVIVGRALDAEPIVTEETLMRLRTLFVSRKCGRPASHNYCLTKVLICGECGSGMVGGIEAGKFYAGTEDVRRNYRCMPATTKASSRGCKTQIDLRTVEADVRELVLDMLSDPTRAHMMAQQSEALAAVTAALEKEKAHKLDLARRQSEGKFDLDEYEILRTPVLARIASLTAQRDALLEAGAGAGAGRTMARRELAQLWSEATADERRRLAQRAFPFGIRIHGRGSRLSPRPLSERIVPITGKP